MFGKDLLSKVRIAELFAPAVMTSASKTGIECDMGTSCWATAIFTITGGTTGITNLGFLTYCTTANPSTQPGGTVVAGNVTTTQASQYSAPQTGIDTLPLTSVKVQSTALVTISANIIAAIGTTALGAGIYIFTLQNIQRFVNCSFTGTDTSAYVSAILIGHEVRDLPYGVPVTVGTGNA
jgi:hypothetical protein